MLERLTHLREILLEDRAALLSGDYSRLKSSDGTVNALTTELETMSEGISSESGDLLIEVQNLAARNARLLAAGIEGTKAAQERITMIRRATSELNTYTSNGQVENVTPRPGKVEKRA